VKKLFITLFLLVNFAFAGEIKSFDDLQNFIKDGWEKGYFPKTIISHQGTKTRLKDINLEFRDTLQWGLNSNCEQHHNEIIIANGDYDDSIMCDGNDNIYILNGGNNELSDPHGDDIVVLGSGNDKIKLSGSAVIIAQNGFGHDEIEFNEPASMDYMINYGYIQGNPYLTMPYKSIIGGYDGSVPYEFHHFIVFGEGIKKSDLSWDGDTLINTKTGDSIKLNTKSVNLLFVDDENPKTDTNFIKSAFKPYDLNIGAEKIDKVFENGEFIYFATERGNLKQGKLIDYKTAKIQKEIWVREFLKNVEFGENFIFVSERGNDELGFLNVFDKDLNFIERLVFKGDVFDIKIHKNILYVLQNYEFNEHNIFVYDISKAGKIELLDSFSVPHLITLEIIDDFIFATNWRRGFSVFDISNPKNPTRLKINLNEISPISIKKYGDFVAIHQEKSIFGIYEIDGFLLNKKCEITFPKEENQRDIFAKVPDSFYILDDTAFVANGEAGVFVVNLKDCSVTENLKITRFPISIFRINDNLVIPERDESFKFIDLRKYFPNYKFIEFEKQKTINLKNNQNNEPKLSEDKIQTLLFESSYHDDYDEAMKYCKVGGNPNFTGHENLTPLEMAANLGNINSIKAMLDCSGKITDRAMMFSVFGDFKGDDKEFEILKLLEQFGGNFGAKDSDGCSMVNYAASHSSLEIIKFLVEKGADAHAKCRHNMSVTPIDWAKSNPNPEVLEYLQNLGK